MSDYVQSIYLGDIPIDDYYTSYNTNGGIIPPGGLIDGANYDFSLWFNRYDDDELTNEHLKNSSIMDNVFRTLFESNPGYAGLYMGFEDGLFRHYPFLELDHYPTMSYICLKDNFQTIGYDPTCRGWYINSKNNYSNYQKSQSSSLWRWNSDQKLDLR